jgi:acyl carrier protein
VPNPWSVLVERQVTEIWNTVLEVTEDERDATFSELGGHAIAAVRIVAGIQDSLGVRIEAGELFRNPALDAFVACVMTKAVPARP